MNRQKIITYIFWGFGIGMLLYQLLAVYLFYVEPGQVTGIVWSDLNKAFNYYLNTDHLILSLVFGVIGGIFGIIVLIRSRIRKLNNIRYREALESEYRAKILMEIDKIQPCQPKLIQLHPAGAFDDLVAEHISAHMNSGGGKIFMSRDINAPVVKLEDVPKALVTPDNEYVKDHLLGIIATQLGPEYLSFVKITQFDQQDFVVWQLTIQPARTPVFVHRSHLSYFYARIGQTTCELDIPEAIDYIEKNWGIV
jgi:hypothetical protein